MASNTEIKAGLKEIILKHGQDNPSAEPTSKWRRQRPNSAKYSEPARSLHDDNTNFHQDGPPNKQTRSKLNKQNNQIDASPTVSDMLKGSQNQKSTDDPRNRDSKKQRLRKQRSKGEDAIIASNRMGSSQKDNIEYKDNNTSSTSPIAKKKKKKRKKKPVGAENEERPVSTSSSKNTDTREADKSSPVIQELESPREPTMVLQELAKEYIHPLKKRSLKFPSARFYCRLCEYHCNSEAVCRKHMKDTRHKRLRMIKTTDILLRSLPPATETHLAALDNLTESVYLQHALTENQLAERQQVTDRVAELIKSKFPDAKVQLSVYGTTATKFGLKDSDLNLDLTADDSAKVLADLHLILKDDQSGYFSEVKSDFGAKVPSVLFKVADCSLKCQLGVNSGSASQTTRLLMAYCNLDPRVKKLAVVFRYWARLCKVDCQDAGTLPPYAFAIMTIYFLQQCSPPVLPVLEELSKCDSKSSDSKFFDNLENSAKDWRTKNDWSLGKLWVCLLKFYAISLDISCMVICVRQKRPLTRDEKKWASKKLAIEDPFSRKRNIARSVSHSHVFEYIYDRLRAAYLYYGVPQTKDGPLLDKVDTSGLEHQLQENLKKLNESPTPSMTALPAAGVAKDKREASKEFTKERSALEEKALNECVNKNVMGSPADKNVSGRTSLIRPVEITKVGKMSTETPLTTEQALGKPMGKEGKIELESGDCCGDAKIDPSIMELSTEGSVDIELGLDDCRTDIQFSNSSNDIKVNDATMAFAASLMDDVLTEAMSDLGISVVSEASTAITKHPYQSPVDGCADLSGSEVDDEATSWIDEPDEETTVAGNNKQDTDAVKLTEELIEESEKDDDDDEEETDEDSDAYEDAKEDIEEGTTSVTSQSSSSVPDKFQNGQISYDHDLLNKLTVGDYVYVFNAVTLSDGKGPAIMCSICQQEGHLKQNCPEDRLPDLEPLPPFTSTYRGLLDQIIMQVPRDFEPKPLELKMRNDVLREIEAFIRQTYPSAKLTLFGSSCNGFGFVHSDLDICMTLAQETSEGIDCVDIIETLAGRLRKHRGLYNVLAITTAKVPIVKFRHRRSQLEGDISLYNTLAQHNTRMLQLYSEADPRVKQLGYTMKVFSKLCNICDASRGSLSSYAYIIIVLYFLQQRRPAVVPVLQEVYKGDKPKLIVEGWNAWYYDSIKNLRKDWPDYGKNKETVGELWLGLLRFYTEEFNFRDYVISVRQHKPLTRFEKLWNGKCVSIEDPFDMSHNLGAGVSRKMNMYIMKALRNGRRVFGTPVETTPLGYTTLSDYLFDPHFLTEGEPPNDRGCRACGKIGHFAKECPVVVARKERNERERERRKEERDINHGDEEPVRNRAQRHDPEPRHSNDNRRTRDNQDNRQHNQNKSNYQGSSPRPIPSGRSYGAGGNHQHTSLQGDSHSPYPGHGYGTSPYSSPSPRVAHGASNMGGTQVFYNSGMRESTHGDHMGTSPYGGRHQQKSAYQTNTTNVDTLSPWRSTTGLLGNHPHDVRSTNKTHNRQYTRSPHQSNAYFHGNQWD